jgi:hypothetical protein
LVTVALMAPPESIVRFATSDWHALPPVQAAYACEPVGVGTVNM